MVSKEKQKNPQVNIGHSESVKVKNLTVFLSHLTKLLIAYSLPLSKKIITFMQLNQTMSFFVITFLFFIENNDKNP